MKSREEGRRPPRPQFLRMLKIVAFIIIIGLDQPGTKSCVFVGSYCTTLVDINCLIAPQKNAWLSCFPDRRKWNGEAVAKQFRLHFPNAIRLDLIRVSIILTFFFQIFVFSLKKKKPPKKNKQLHVGYYRYD